MARKITDQRGMLVDAFSGEGMLTARSPIVSGSGSEVFFQNESISNDVIEKIYGTPDEFFEEYEAFQSRYQSRVSKLFAGRKEATANIVKQLGLMDLGLFARDITEEMASDYKNNVLKLGRLIQEVGLPSRQMPNANAFRTPYMFDIDMTNIVHPIQLLLGGQMFNFNPDKKGVESLNVSRLLMSQKTLKNTWSRISKFSEEGGGLRIFDEAPDTPRRKVATLDIETTGAFQGSQMRSIAVRFHEIDEYGNMIEEFVEKDGKRILKPADYNISFKSNQLNAMYGVLDDTVMEFNDFIHAVESPSGTLGKVVDIGKDDGMQFLDEMTSLLGRLSAEDVSHITGHNISGFDIDKIIKTMLAQPAFARHKGASEAVKKFLDRAQSEEFIVDSLAYARSYMLSQVNEAVRAGASGVLEESKAFVNSLFAEDILARVDIGGSSAYASMEAVALNTNLFELMAKEDQADELFKLIFQGSHIAETDIHLEDYMAKYIQSGELKIKALMDMEAGGSSWQSEVGNYARRVAFKSQAITVTTNIASVRQMSKPLRQYFKTGEGNKGVKLSLRMTDSFLTSEETSALFGDEADRKYSRGILSFERNTVFDETSGRYLDKEGYVFRFVDRIADPGADAVDEVEIDEGLARRLINRVIKGAENPEYTKVDVPITLPDGRTITVREMNAYDDAILETNVNFSTNSRVMQLLERVGRPVSLGSKMDDISAIEETLGSTSKVFGRKSRATRNRLGKIRSMFAREGSNVFERGGLARLSLEESVEAADKFKEIGDVYADALDNHSRIFSNIISRGTADYGKRAALNVSLASEASDGLSDSLAFARRADILTDFNVGFFEPQKVVRLVDPGKATGLPTSRVMVTQEMVRKMLEEISPDKKMDMRVGFSIMREQGDNPARVNLFLRTNEMLTRDQARQGAEFLYETIVGSTDLGEALGDITDASAKSVSAQAAALGGMSPAQKAEYIENLAQSMMDKRGGLVFGFVEGDTASTIISGLEQNELVDGNDTVFRFTAGIADTPLGDEVIVVSPSVDSDAQKILRTLGEAGVVSSGDAERQVRNANEVAKTIEATDSVDRITTKMKAAEAGDEGLLSLRSLYSNNKTNIRNALIGAAAAGVGYYAYKRSRENDIYNETLETQPTSRPKYNQNTSTVSNNYSNGRRNNSDPLATAGVVGNLDRMRIGHTQMGNDRHNHLFGGM